MIVAASSQGDYNTLEPERTAEGPAVRCIRHETPAQDPPGRGLPLPLTPVGGQGQPLALPSPRPWPPRASVIVNRIAGTPLPQGQGEDQDQDQDQGEGQVQGLSFPWGCLPGPCGVARDEDEAPGVFLVGFPAPGLGGSGPPWGVPLMPVPETNFGGGGAAPPDYPDCIAKSPLRYKPSYDLNSDACGMWALVGECEDGHMYAHTLNCGREWCEKCREASHNRRKARWMPKARQMRNMGYMVVSTPPELRQKYRDMQELSHLGTLLKEGLQRQGVKRGLYRLHWFGEETNGQTPGFHPHWNFILDAGYLAPERLEAIKAMVARVLHVAEARVNVHYEYTDKVRQMLHILSYVLRPTFLQWEWDEELAWRARAFRNCRSFGHWNDPPAWKVPVDSKAEAPSVAITFLSNGRCPKDGTPITWRGPPVHSGGISEHWDSLGDGFYAWPGPGPPGPGPG